MLYYVSCLLIFRPVITAQLLKSPRVLLLNRKINNMPLYALLNRAQLQYAEKCEPYWFTPAYRAFYSGF